MMTQHEARNLVIEVDGETGQLRSIADKQAGREVIRFAPGHEYELNGRPIKGGVIGTEKTWGCPLTRFDVRQLDCYMAGARYELHRTVVPGVEGPVTGQGHSVHLRHSLLRVPWGDWEQPLDDLWKQPLESPQRVNQVSVLCAPTPWFGQKTHLRAVAIGGSGPREHVSLEDGPIEQVLPWLQTRFRTTFPGQCTVPGAMYYDPEDERWVWIVVHQPTLGGDVTFSRDGLRFNFYPFRDMAVHDRVVLPDVSIYYGQGLADADRLMANLFVHFEEPPDWWYHTTWFWLHPVWQANGSFEQAREAVDLLMDRCGVNGFGMLSHDRLPGGLDCECDTPAASSALGGPTRLKALLRHIRDKGGHTYTWMARYGKLASHGPGGWRDQWAIRGIDSRPLGHQSFRICDAHAPGFRDYLRRWLEYNLEMGFDGIFWDSAFQPMVPNFSDASADWLNCPGEAMAGGPAAYDELYALGKRLHEDFFMWGEGINTECRMNAFAVDNRTHGEHSGHALMHRIAHAGPRRLVWRSAWPHDVSGAFPFIKPVNDVGKMPESGFYQQVADDPVNQWLCRTVRQLGCRQAVGVADGIAVLDDLVVVSPDEQLLGTVRIPEHLVRGKSLVHELSGTRVEGQAADGGIDFLLPETGPWKML